MCKNWNKKEYIIKYNFNGQEYENKYVPTIDFSQSNVKDIAYEALMSALDYNKHVIEGNCIRHIELFQENEKTLIYSAETYTKGMGFLLKADIE